MSNFQYIDVDDEQFEDAPRALRQAYAALKKAHEVDTKELSTLRTQVQTRTASEVLKDKGYNPKAAKFLLKDGVDLNDEKAVDAWLAEEGEFFKVAGQESTPGSEQTVEHDAEAEARSQIADATSHTQTAANDRMKAALAEITDNMTTQEVMAVYKKHGI